VYHDRLALSGRISAQYQNNGKDEALHGNFEWTQTASTTTVTLLSPLGQTLAVIEVAPDRAIMTQSGKPPRTAADVDRLAAEVLGWPLPVSGLRNWLQGFGNGPDGRKFTAFPQGPDSHTTADGWQLRYAAWQEEGQSARPRRIDLKRSTTEAGDVSIRIVIDNWNAN
jgi:outer membrane lipoprotein LolB